MAFRTPAGTFLRRATLVAMVGLLLMPAWGMAAARPPSSSELPASSASGAVSVTWNGANISSASTESSAFSVASSDVIGVSFRWSPALGAEVANARLQMFYLGFAVAASTVSPIGSLSSPTGAPATSAAMNWTVGWIQYAVEGVFRLSASLVASNGSSIWSEDFYVRMAAPGSILAAAPILLIILGVVELYAIATSGRQAATSRPPKDRSGPPSPPSPGTPPATTGDAAPPPSPSADSPPTGGPA
jgi:hypothetical protein